MNLAFLVTKTMRFYGWSWETAMKTPISAFWTCYSYIGRLRADEMMNRLPEHTFSMLDESGRKELVEGLQEQIGTVVVEKPVFDQQGWRTLKNLSQ